MSLHQLANHIQSAGRGEDKMLVHMTPKEVESLQTLAKAKGGSLTINPHTGLPEAGFLSNLLPTIAGAALTAAFPEVSPWLISGGIGALDYAVTGNLGQGLMAGLGAYGGSDLASGMMKSGTEGITSEAAQKAALEAPKNVQAQALDPTKWGSADTTGMFQAPMASAPQGVYTGDLASMPSDMQQQVMAQRAAVNDVYAANPGATASVGQQLQAGANQAMANPMDFAKNNWKTLASAAAPILPDLMKPQTNTPAIQHYAGPLNNYHLASNYQGAFPTQPNPYYVPTGLGYAMGGPVEGMDQGGIAALGGQSNMYPQSQQEHTQFATPSQMPTSAEVVDSDYDTKTDAYTGQEIPKMASGGKTPKAKYTSQAQLNAMDPWEASQASLDNDIYFSKGPGAVMRTPASMSSLGDVKVGLAHGGIASLGGYSDGGQMLKGPGDGMSDSIPASIGGKQPARLADGEFVVPADVVSHLGNGSTDAGSRKLYAMMDKVRQARTGKKKQAPEINPNKVMPA